MTYYFIDLIGKINMFSEFLLIMLGVGSVVAYGFWCMQIETGGGDDDFRKPKSFFKKCTVVWLCISAVWLIVPSKETIIISYGADYVSSIKGINGIPPKPSKAMSKALDSYIEE